MWCDCSVHFTRILLLGQAKISSPKTDLKTLDLTSLNDTLQVRYVVHESRVKDCGFLISSLQTWERSFFPASYIFITNKAK